MQPSSSLSRSSQRPKHPSESGKYSPTSQFRSGSIESASGSRSSSGSARAQSARGNAVVPDKQISQIEKSVTHLLVATKQLLETLTQWSRQQASENEVSDVYVRLGYEFNLACRAFNAIGVDTSDLGPVPDLLRTILEDTLSQDASPQSLDRYLPRIRDIIINLLHGLKKKQARLRSRQQRDDSRGLPGRQGSSASAASGPPGTTQVHEEYAPTSPSKRPWTRRYGSGGSVEDQPILPRSSSANAMSDARGGSYSEREASRREMPNGPPLPYPGGGSPSVLATPSSNSSPYPPPPPPPKQDDAIGALQRSGELERRASRRFSAYQIQKHLGASSNGVPVLPSQNSPVPNRGRDARESLNAVRLRGSYAHGRQRPTNRSHEQNYAKSGLPQIPPSIPDEGEEGHRDLRVEPPTAGPPSDSPTAKTPEDKVCRPSDWDRGVSINGPQPSLPPGPEEVNEKVEPAKDSMPAADVAPATPQPTHQAHPTVISTPPQASPFTSEQPTPGKELTLFLQYRSKIKKYILPEGFTGLTLGRLQLAFIEKFAWNTHNNGADLPEIYIQDPISGVRHELEDLSDVKDRSVLVLNVDALDEVRRHFDEGFGGVRNLIEGVKAALEEQESSIQRVSESQLEAAKEIARLATAPRLPVPNASNGGGKPKGPISGSDDQITELQSLRRDLAVLRQTYSNFTSDIGASMSAIRTKAKNVKSVAVDMSVPSYEGNAGRARVNSGKKELADESERLVARVDDLQDLVEDLRKDVVSRGVRPLPRQLDSVSRDISDAVKQIKKMKEFLKREKPVWTKIWEAELQLVCEERDQLTMQEDLAADLEDDVEKAAQTFALVEQATKQQEAQVANGIVLRNNSRNLIIEPAADPMKAKDDMLGEVRALQPNHESRLEAIERAEKARRKELESRGVGRFQKELGTFVQEGKLKKSGGVEETERIRRTKDERIRKEVWERQQARAAEIEKTRREAAESAQAGQPVETEHEPENENPVDTTAENGGADAAEGKASPAEASDLEQEQEKAQEVQEGQEIQETKENQEDQKSEERHEGDEATVAHESDESQKSQESEIQEEGQKGEEAAKNDGSPSPPGA
ncbi:hypothetical protein MAP00_000653 [Monascus purpureus]|nr:hypothetical protein MAP00_000653 [Monascus purpureus]